MNTFATTPGNRTDSSDRCALSAPEALNQRQFSSRRSPYRVFRELLWDQIIGVDPPPREPSPFDMNVQLLQLGGSRIAVIDNRGGAIEVARTRRRIAADGEQSLVVGICLEGTQCLSLRPGCELATKPSELLVTHSCTPHVGITAPRTRIGLLILPDGAARAGGHPVHSSASDGLPRVLSESLRALFEELPRLGAAEMHALVASILPLVSAVAAPSTDTNHLAGASVKEAQRRRVVRFIEANLTEPGLSASWIAARLRMSVRYLHALFADADLTVGETILSKRLERCREAFVEPSTAHLSLLELALRFGFNDPSHFSRSYRRRFGASPREDRSRLRAPSMGVVSGQPPTVLR